MRHATTVALLSGPLVVLGYVATSLVYCELRRRQHDDGADRTITTAAAVALMALLTTTIAYYATRQVAPGAERAGIALFAPSALFPWESVALWTGVAAVLGHVAPIWNGFKGGSGLPAALVVGFVYVPVVLMAGGVGFFAATLIWKQPRRSAGAAIGVAVAVAWTGWVLEWQDAWGLPLGPETTLGVVVAAGLIATSAFGHRSPFPS
jgi:glycerol-3-phosphate acyltransferase PlsY